MHFQRLILAVILTAMCGPAIAQDTAPDALRIEWQVKNRFRLFRNDSDFERQVAALKEDGIRAAETRMESAGDGRGWAKDVVDRLCVDAAGQLRETCQRDGETENYLAPKDHRVNAVLAGQVPEGSRCTWDFDDGTVPVQRITVDCRENVTVRLRYGKPTVASVGVVAPDGGIQQATTEIAVRDLLIAGLGDSIGAGEGDPDKPVRLSDIGFCFRDFAGNQYFRPGREGYSGDKSCGSGATKASAETLSEWQRYGAGWMNAPCHRSLYGYQLRAALALAVQNPHLAVTFLPLACAGASIDAGMLGSQRIEECAAADRAGSCSGKVPGQIAQLTELVKRAGRKLDLALLTVGANDINFSGLVADVIIEPGAERAVFSRSGVIERTDDAARILQADLPMSFAKLRAALKPLVGGELSRVVFVTYGHLALTARGRPCPGGRDGFDVHPALSADGARLRNIADFLASRFLPEIKGLALCQGGAICAAPDSDRMTFVDNHQADFAGHGFCARADSDPEFDRACFSADGESFQSDPVKAVEEPMVCGMRPSDFKPYAPRSRWVRTANDSYFTSMTYPDGLPSVLQPADIHDATWGILSAVYGGAIHPTAEGYAAMADAALPAMRAVLDLPPAPSVTSAPLPPLE